MTREQAIKRWTDIANTIFWAEERIAKEKPALSGCLAKLRELLPKEVFDRSFAKVENLSKSGEALLIVTNAMHRSFIERDCIGALKEAFGVKYVRVVG